MSQPEPAGPPPTLLPMGRFHGRGWVGWLLSSIWLIYLQDALTAAWRNPHPALRILGLAALVGFGVAYLRAWYRIRRTRQLGTVLTAMQRLALVLPALLLAALAIPAAGQRALSTTVFLVALIMFALPSRIAFVLVAALILAEEISSRAVPGWKPTDLLGLQVFLAALAMWGIGQLLLRNAELAAAQQQLAELAVAQERTRFARDLHDILGHSLTVLTVKTELAGRLVRIDPERAEAEIGEVERLARNALADVRAAVAGYREANLAHELIAARAALDAAGIEAVLPGAIDDVPGERRELFGWAVREGVTNVVRHSGASRCTVRVSPQAVEVSDDGRGPARANGQRAGHGLSGLRERAAQVGAALTVAHSPEGGFLLRVGW